MVAQEILDACDDVAGTGGGPGGGGGGGGEGALANPALGNIKFLTRKEFLSSPANDGMNHARCF